jgi:hypothetical protein
VTTQSLFKRTEGTATRPTSATWITVWRLFAKSKSQTGRSGRGDPSLRVGTTSRRSLCDPPPTKVFDFSIHRFSVSAFPCLKEGGPLEASNFARKVKYITGVKTEFLHIFLSGSFYSFLYKGGVLVGGNKRTQEQYLSRQFRHEHPFSKLQLHDFYLFLRLCLWSDDWGLSNEEGSALQQRRQQSGTDSSCSRRGGGGSRVIDQRNVYIVLWMDVDELLNFSSLEIFSKNFLMASTPKFWGFSLA